MDVIQAEFRELLEPSIPLILQPNATISSTEELLDLTWSSSQEKLLAVWRTSSPKFPGGFGEFVSFCAVPEFDGQYRLPVREDEIRMHIVKPRGTSVDVHHELDRQVNQLHPKTSLEAFLKSLCQRLFAPERYYVDVIHHILAQYQMPEDLEPFRHHPMLNDCESKAQEAIMGRLASIACGLLDSAAKAADGLEKFDAAIECFNGLVRQMDQYQARCSRGPVGLYSSIPSSSNNECILLRFRRNCGTYCWLRAGRHQDDFDDKDSLALKLSRQFIQSQMKKSHSLDKIRDFGFVINTQFRESSCGGKDVMNTISDLVKSIADTLTGDETKNLCNLIDLSCLGPDGLSWLEQFCDFNFEFCALKSDNDSGMDADNASSESEVVALKRANGAWFSETCHASVEMEFHSSLFLLVALEAITSSSYLSSYSPLELVRSILSTYYPKVLFRVSFLFYLRWLREIYPSPMPGVFGLVDLNDFRFQKFIFLEDSEAHSRPSLSVFANILSRNISNLTPDYLLEYLQCEQQHGLLSRFVSLLLACSYPSALAPIDDLSNDLCQSRLKLLGSMSQYVNDLSTFVDLRSRQTAGTDQVAANLKASMEDMILSAPQFSWDSSVAPRMIFGDLPLMSALQMDAFEKKLVAYCFRSTGFSQEATQIAMSSTRMLRFEPFQELLAESLTYLDLENFVIDDWLRVILDRFGSKFSYCCRSVHLKEALELLRRTRHLIPKRLSLGLCLGLCDEVVSTSSMFVEFGGDGVSNGVLRERINSWKAFFEFSLEGLLLDQAFSAVWSMYLFEVETAVDGMCYWRECLRALIVHACSFGHLGWLCTHPLKADSSSSVVNKAVAEELELLAENIDLLTNNNEERATSMTYYECLVAYLVSKGLYSEAGRVAFNLVDRINSDNLDRNVQFMEKQLWALSIGYNCMQLDGSDNFVVSKRCRSLGEGKSSLQMISLVEWNLKQELVSSRLELALSNQSSLESFEDSTLVSTVLKLLDVGKLSRASSLIRVATEALLHPDYLQKGWMHKFCVGEEVCSCLEALIRSTCYFCLHIGDKNADETHVEMEGFLGFRYPCSMDYSSSSWNILLDLLCRVDALRLPYGHLMYEAACDEILSNLSPNESFPDAVIAALGPCSSSKSTTSDAIGMFGGWIILLRLMLEKNRLLETCSLASQLLERLIVELGDASTPSCHRQQFLPIQLFDRILIASEEEVAKLSTKGGPLHEALEKLNINCENYFSLLLIQEIC